MSARTRLSLHHLARASLPALCVLATSAHAQSNQRFERECAEWISKKGYSSDYIEQRAGSKPAGDSARDWVANLAPKDVQPDDVVLLYVESADGRGRRAEVVDEVLREADGSITALRTSSMNTGKLVEPRCHVTENFGKVTQRKVNFDRVQGAWRPTKR